MTSIQELLIKYIELKGGGEQVPKSERHELVSKFAQRINESRERDGLKPLPSKFFNMKMAQSGLKSNGDLYWFFAYCNETKNFDKTWWWSLKVK